MVVNAAESSNKSQAIKKYRVSKCNVQRWRAQKDSLTMGEPIVVLKAAALMILKNQCAVHEMYMQLTLHFSVP